MATASAKPTHLSAEYASQFQQSDVAHAYRTRPPYPHAVFELLASLLPAAARVLELGAGTGDLSCDLAARCATLDAVEPSAAMLAIARKRRSSQPIVWHPCAAEAFAFEGPYDLVVAAESLHWMAWDVVLPKIAGALARDGQLAIIAERKLTVPWHAELRELIGHCSTNRDYQPYDLVALLAERGLFRETGRRTIHSAFSQGVEDYVASFHSRNGLSTERMGVAASRAFDAALRGILVQHGSHVRVQAGLAVEVVWGRPRS